MSASAAAGPLVPQLVVIGNEDKNSLSVEGSSSVVERPNNLDNTERSVRPYKFNEEFITPSVPENIASDDKAYAEQFFEMLKMREQFQETDGNIVFENMISKVLLQCLLSGILGFIYNTYINDFSIYNKQIAPGDINDHMFKLLASILCKEDEMSEVANLGENGKECFMPDDHSEHAKFISSLISSVNKENTLTPQFKEFLGVEPPRSIENFGQHYETLLEMVMRLGNPQESDAPETQHIQLRILKSVCQKIVLLLTSVDIIKNNTFTPIYNLFEPVVGAAIDVASNNTTFVGRLRSLVILAAAYNSYGWLFAIIAPFAIPAIGSIATGTVKGIGKIAMLPIKLIQRVGTGFGKQKPKKPPRPDAINKLICIGYTNKELPGNGGILKIPYFINLNDLLDLSEELQSWEFAKRSLLSTMCIGHGVFDLGDWQNDGLTMEKQRLLSATNPLVTLFGYIADEFTQITTLNYDSPPAAAASASSYEYDYINVISDQMLNVVANTMKDDNLIEFAQTEMMKTTIGVWLGFLHESASVARSALLILGKTIAITAAEAAQRSNPLFRNDTESSNISDITESSESLSRGSSDSGSSGSSGSSESSINSRINSKDMTIIFTSQSPPLSRNVSNDSELSFMSTNSGTTDKTLKVNLVAVAELAEVAVAVEAEVAEAVEASQAEAEAIRFLFSPGFISKELNSVVRPEEILYDMHELIVAEAKEGLGVTPGSGEEALGGYRRKHSNMMSRDAAKMQNKLIGQHRTVNNQKVMQYMPEHDLNQRKFFKGRKSKNYRNKKQKTKKRNKKLFKKRQTKKVLRKRRTTKKRYGMKN
jgi:hypothetical protein